MWDFGFRKENFIFREMATQVSYTQEALVSGLRKKDRDCFAVLYDNYSSALLGIIFNIVKDKDEAENVLQDAFIKIWKNIGLYDASKGSLFTWLLTISRNTALDYLRKRGRVPLVEIQNELQDVYTISETVQDVGLRNEVFKLEKDYRDVIKLIYFFGYTQQQVSEILKIPLGTVKTRTRTALQLLRKKYGSV